MLEQYRLYLSRNLLFLVVFIGLFTTSFVSADEATRQKAIAWISAHKSVAEKELAVLKDDEVQAQAALNQAQAAVALAVKLDDHAALPIAQEAVRLAQGHKDEVAARLKKTEAAVENLRKVLLWSLPQDETFGVPGSVTGNVQKLADGRWVTLDPGAPLKVGETVSTNEGRMRLYFQDGTRLELGPKSTFKFEKQIPEDSIYRLIKGKIHNYQIPNSVRGQINYHMPIAVASVRGTEFDLYVDDNDLSHLIPYTGKIEFAAESAKTDRSRLNRWWEQGSPASPSGPLTDGKLMRIASVQGEVNITAADGKSRTAAGGDLLGKGDKLATGSNGLARVNLVGGYHGVLAADTLIEGGVQDKTGQPCYSIQRGRFYAAAGAIDKSQDTPPVFITPNTTAAVQNAEFEVAVDGNGLADFVVLSGSLEVTAQPDKLDLETIKPWWRE